VEHRRDRAQLRRLVRARPGRGGLEPAAVTRPGARLTVGLVGNLAVDRIAGGAPRVGGAVYHGARAATRLASDTVVVTRCAERDRDVCLTPLVELGLPVTWRPARETTAFSFHYEGDRRVMSVDAVGDPWTPEDVASWAGKALAGTTWVHVGGLLRTDFPPAVLRSLAVGGRRLLVDGQGLVRRGERGPLRSDGDVDRSLLSSMAVLKLDEEEAALLAGGTGEADLRALGVPEVIVTLGSRGSFVVAEGSAERIRTEPLGEAVDPTGAGDAFGVAYAVARDRGFAPLDAAREATTVVSSLLDGR
jgi:sugar/nucleoside kinase (ribokinase family)